MKHGLRLRPACAMLKIVHELNQLQLCDLVLDAPSFGLYALCTCIVSHLSTSTRCASISLARLKLVCELCSSRLCRHPSFIASTAPSHSLTCRPCCMRHAYAQPGRGTHHMHAMIEHDRWCTHAQHGMHMRMRADVRAGAGAGDEHARCPECAEAQYGGCCACARRSCAAEAAAARPRADCHATHELRVGPDSLLLCEMDCAIQILTAIALHAHAHRHCSCAPL